MVTVVGVILRSLAGREFPPKLALNRAYFEAIRNAGPSKSS
jgi:hypothetical protein